LSKQRHPHVEQAERLMQDYLDDLKAIVNIDSGTYTKAGVDRVGAYLQERFQDFGFSTTIDRQEQYGNHLIATHSGSASNGPHLLLIGHMDTVFSEGEAEKRPFALGQRNGMRIATGPGVLDMKSGILIGLYGLHLLIEPKQANYRQVTFVCNSDEEVGSLSSKPLIQELAKDADAVLVLEPGRAENTIVSSRKGCGQYRVEVYGLSAHAGVEPQKGRNAILELSYQVQRMQAINGTIPGATLNVGIIRGGERTNVVPDYAYFEMDARVTKLESIAALEAAIQKAVSKTVLQGTKIVVSGGFICQPFERNERNARLVQLAQAAGRELGLDIQDVGSGGASDANTSAAMGIPTLDGLGAGGGLAHNPDEYIELDYLPERIALLAELIEQIGKHSG
jgi:glutamate carboxypeptidase